MNKSEDIIYNFNWYPNELPKKDDVVIVRKVCIDELGAWVDLLEYGCKRGFIPLSCPEQCRKLGERKIKMGKIALSTVLRVDYEKNNIDLKHYSVKDENVKNAEKRFYNYRKLLKFLYQISLKDENIQYHDLLKKVVYPLHEKYGNAYQAFLKSYKQPEIVNKLEIPKNIKNFIFEKVEKVFNQSKIKILALFEAEIYKFDHDYLLHQLQTLGCEMEKEMKFDDPFSNSEKQNNNSKLNISIVKVPVYSISIDVFNKEQGILFVNKVLKKIEIRLKEEEGKFVMRKETKVIKQEDYKETIMEICRTTDSENEADDEL